MATARSKRPKPLSIADLKAAPYNPRKISEEAIAGLKVSLAQFGDLSGLTWNKRSGNLVAGHQRLRALKEQHGDALKIEGGEVVTPSGERFKVRVVDWPDSKERLANIAANNPHIAGDFTDDVEDLIHGLQQTDAQIAELVGSLRLDELLSSEPEEVAGGTENIYEVSVACADEPQQKQLYERLTADGFSPNVLTMPLTKPGSEEAEDTPPAKSIAPKGGKRIVVESKITDSFRVAQVRGMFDVPTQKTIRHEWNVNLPVDEKPWLIGLIVGPSGSGKTTIARQLFPKVYYHTGYSWPEKAALIDGFPKSLSGEVITAALSSVGFSSPPHWLKPYAHLSNGQKFRCDLARLMLEEHNTVIFDEFTSVVDREAAKISSAAVAKAIRRRNKTRLIALSCHFDVIDWLDPDWVYNVATGEFAWRLLRQRPAVQLEIHEATSAAWNLFAGHHYLSRTINRSAKCFVATWEGVPVAFTSHLALPHAKMKRARREHRTVVLPDFQGVGIGNALSEWLGAHLKAQRLRFRSTTSHPAMIRHRRASPNWKMTRFGRANPTTGKSTAGSLTRTLSASRLTASFEYAGEPLQSPDREHQRTPATPSTESAPRRQSRRRCATDSGRASSRRSNTRRPPARSTRS